MQERIVAGERLGEEHQAHVLGCTQCARFAADCLALDSMVENGVDAAVSVPDDFADRVMRNLDVANPGVHWQDFLGRRWIQVVLANLGVAVAVINLVRFVFSALIPTASLGGVP
jgi:hypothetical protein